jgi:hypothetical protein
MPIGAKYLTANGFGVNRFDAVGTTTGPRLTYRNILTANSAKSV